MKTKRHALLIGLASLALSLALAADNPAVKKDLANCRANGCSYRGGAKAGLQYVAIQLVDTQVRFAFRRALDDLIVNRFGIFGRVTGAERPADFTSKPGDKRAFTVWKPTKSEAPTERK
jgi:hypothetical protein